MIVIRIMMSQLIIVIINNNNNNDSNDNNGPLRVVIYPRSSTKWILPIQSLRIGRGRRVPDSSNHSLCLIKLSLDD